jgi:hypothetical protein
MSVDFKSKGFKLFVMWITSLGVLALAYFSVVFPIHLAVVRESKKVSNMSTEVDKTRLYISDANVQKVEREAETLADALDRFVSRNSMAGECTYVISDIASKAGAEDFTTKQKTPKALSDIQNCQLIKAALVEISCKGSYTKFLRLVNEYERSRPVVLIDKFTITVIESGKNVIKMSLLVLVGEQVEPI